jgi:hypothetical protein
LSSKKITRISGVFTGNPCVKTTICTDLLSRHWFFRGDLFIASNRRNWVCDSAGTGNECNIQVAILFPDAVAVGGGSRTVNHSVSGVGREITVDSVIGVDLAAEPDP